MIDIWACSIGQNYQMYFFAENQFKSPPQPFLFMFIQKWKFYTSLNPSLIQENTSSALIFGWIMDPKFSLQLGHLSQ